MIAAFSFFGLTLSETAFLFVAAGYVASLVRDWRPMKSLREENRDLRNDLNRASARIAELEAARGDLEHQIKDLERATDYSSLQKSQKVLQENQQRIADTLKTVADALSGLESAVRANTTSVEVIARASVIAEAISASEEKKR